LPSAHTLMTLRTGELKKRRYWRLEPGPRLRLSSDDEYAEALREQISTATLSRLRSAYPVGVMLSGGLDSSAVACIAARGLRKQGQRLTAVCSVLPEDHSGPEVDEREYIEAVRSQEDNIDLVHVFAEGVTPFGDLENQFLRMRRPSYDVFGYMTEALFRAGHDRGVRALLNGFGGDSAASFSGMGSLAQFIGRWIELVRQRLRSQDPDGQAAWRMLMREIISPLSPDFVFRFYRRITGKKPLDWTSRYSIHPALARRMGLDLPVRNRTLPRACDLIIDYVNSGQLQELLEEWASRGAAVALEPRYPLLDRRLIEFCVRVPPGQHVRGGHGRSLIRRAMEGVAPSEVQWRTTKEPFTPDYHRRVLSAKQRLVDFLMKAGEEDKDIAWEYVSRTKIEQALERLKPWEAGTLWETDAQRIIGRGIEMARFVKWFDRAHQF
jgi:asparagine synthase (glutamine-hydrolysing)